MKLIAVVLAALATTVGQSTAANPIQAENSLGGSTGWRGEEARGKAIEGYTSEISVAPGDTVHFHVSTDPAEPYRITVYRLGWYGGSGGRAVASIPGSGYPALSSGSGWLGAGWPVTSELRIPDDWVSGYYVARFELLAGEQAGRTASAIFIVRAPPNRRAPILIQVPVNTWEAYNPWGGKSLYNDNSIGGVHSSRVSFDRPLPPSYFQTWEWEIQLVRFLEREGYDVSYQTDVDTHRDPASLLRHRLVMVDGHGEYWTSRIRDAFDAARDAGTNLAFIGANTGYWQVRYEDGERTVVGYKSLPDPVTDPTLQSVLFRALNPPRLECELMGVQYQGALRHAGDPPGDYSVNPAAVADPWFAGTGFTDSTVLPGLVGLEWDQIPNVLQPECMKPGLVVLFHYNSPSGNADAIRYVAPSGARVFSAGSLQFAWGLDNWLPPSRGVLYPALPGLQQFMRNALADLTRPAAPVITGKAVAGNVVLRIAQTPDPRITSTVVSRGGKVVCKALARQCIDRGLAGHRSYVYTAVDVDEWSVSASTTVRIAVPNGRPTLSLRGPARARAGALAAYAALATDRDDDTLRFAWRLDGHRVPAGGKQLSAVFRRPGRHIVAVEVSDGHGGRATASLSVLVRR